MEIAMIILLIGLIAVLMAFKSPLMCLTVVVLSWYLAFDTLYFEMLAFLFAVIGLIFLCNAALLVSHRLGYYG